MEENVPEEHDIMASDNIKTALEQLEYLQIHSGFKDVKKTLIENFLKNQDEDLQNHIKERTINLLSLAKQYEGQNQRTILNKITSSVKEELNQIEKSPSKEVLEGSFMAALKGIKEGKMSYEGDKVLPLVQSKIKEQLQKYKKMSPEQLSDLLTLSDEQINGLRQADQQLDY